MWGSLEEDHSPLLLDPRAHRDLSPALGVPHTLRCPVFGPAGLLPVPRRTGFRFLAARRAALERLVSDGARFRPRAEWVRIHPPRLDAVGLIPSNRTHEQTRKTAPYYPPRSRPRGQASRGKRGIEALLGAFPIPMDPRCGRGCLNCTLSVSLVVVGCDGHPLHLGAGGDAGDPGSCRPRDVGSVRWPRRRSTAPRKSLIRTDIDICTRRFYGAFVELFSSAQRISTHVQECFLRLGRSRRLPANGRRRSRMKRFLLAGFVFAEGGLA